MGYLHGMVDAPCFVSQLVTKLNSGQMQHKFVTVALTGAGL